VKRDRAVLLFAMLFPAVMAWIYFVALAGESPRENPALQLAIGAGKAFQFVFPVVYVWFVEPQRLRPTSPTRRGLAFGLGFGLAVGAAIYGLYLLLWRYTIILDRTPPQVFAKVRELGLDTPLKFVLLGAFVSVVHSLLEEYYWRWFVFGRLRRHLSLASAIVLSSLAFMLHHVIVLGVYFPGQLYTVALPFSLAVAAGGGVWAWLYARTGSIYAPWLSHLLIDAAIMAVGFDMMSGYW
jgi:membrane protease YdiL (CAAX protease family)